MVKLLWPKVLHHLTWCSKDVTHMSVQELELWRREANSHLASQEVPRLIRDKRKTHGQTFRSGILNIIS